MKIGDRVKIISSSTKSKKCNEHIGKYGSIVYGYNKYGKGTVTPGDELNLLYSKACVKIDNQGNSKSKYDGYWYHIDDMRLMTTKERLEDKKHYYEQQKQNESEENNMMIQNEKGTIERTAHCKEILDLWKENTKEEVLNWGDNTRNKIIAQDKIGILAIQYGKELVSLIDDEWRHERHSVGQTFIKENFIINEFNFNNIFTKETRLILNQINIVIDDYIKEVKNNYDEILTLLNATETYEQEQEILKVYDIIRDNGRMYPIYLTSELNRRLNEKLEVSEEGDTDAS